jgi:Uma2 family endonuclease
MSRVALTYKDYAALPNDGQRYQILDGELCVTPAPNPLHQELSMRLASLLHIHVTTHGLGEVYAAPIDVILSEEPSSTTIVQPDIVFVANDRLDRISRRAVDGAPTLAIEILSPSTASLDRRLKFEAYARLGVPYYWIVDPEARTIEMYRQAAGAYALIARASGDAPVAAEPFPGLSLAALWP